jgi:hypothetical protein
MIEYTIVSGSEDNSVARKVNALLQQGWKLQGGISVATNSNLNQYYSQALIREHISLFSIGKVEK